MKQYALSIKPKVELMKYETNTKRINRIDQSNYLGTRPLFVHTRHFDTITNMHTE